MRDTTSFGSTSARAPRPVCDAGEGPRAVDPSVRDESYGTTGRYSYITHKGRRPLRWPSTHPPLRLAARGAGGGDEEPVA